MFRACVAILCLTGWLWACHDDERAPPPPDFPSTTGGSFNAGGASGILVPPPNSGRLATCGGEVLIAQTEAPILYFVIDRSGSMSEPFSEEGSKYDAAREAVGNLLDSIGHRVRYGAAVYPSAAEQCDSGRQIFSPTLGDDPSSVREGQRGSVLVALLNRLAAEAPSGSTPTAAVLRRTRLVLEGRGTSFVILLTDGAPNCGTTPCESESCIPDIERVKLDDTHVCGLAFSCCDSASVGRGAAANCIDSVGSEAAVAALAQDGVPTYVVGMPGSEAYAALLDRLAKAGGTARGGASEYYAVSDAEELAEAMAGIGAQVSLDCQIALASPPADPSLINVFFDGQPVPRDAENGWAWLANGPETAAETLPGAERTSLELRGPACVALRAGEVRTVEITYGCETILR